MTLVLALLAVVGACLLWPSGQSLVAHASAGAPGPESEPDHVFAMSGASRAVTVDEAADALVLCALALRSGLGPIEALEAVAHHVGGAVALQLRVVASAHRWGQDAATSWGHVGEAWRPAALAWQAAEQSGAAPAGVVLAAAERMRREEASRVEAAVQRAGVLLVLPLGACFLPGFIGTTVVPVVLHLARSSLGVG
ncbi:type II secretion system F family protein [Knoellia sp. CPCC 206453]|uniref:type II secretion system F family protein n=1 Tax=Knoellia pratensis TaxID=3404796 RepID=UPI00360DC6B6